MLEPRREALKEADSLTRGYSSKTFDLKQESFRDIKLHQQSSPRFFNMPRDLFIVITIILQGIHSESRGIAELYILDGLVLVSGIILGVAFIVGFTSLGC